jgi:hypothetical protein
MQLYPAEAAVCKTDSLQRGVDLLRRAQIFIEPFVINNSFHNRNAIQASDNPMT